MITLPENRKRKPDTAAAEAWTTRVEECRKYLEAVARSVESGRSMRLGPSPQPLRMPDSLGAAVTSPAKVVYCSPHPDDESISGAVALRLRLETGAQITDVAITLGSDLSQRSRRRRELEAACGVLGFKLVIPQDPGDNDGEAAGFSAMNLKARQKDPEGWAARVEALAAIFDQERPDAVFAPHAEDFNTTHIGANALVVEALGEHLARSGRGPVTVIETEFWHQLSEPNLMAGISAETLAIMLAAQMEHGGEMSRNPYHLLAPARMMDNIRRGSEVVGGQGAPAQNYKFAELHRVVFMRGRDLVTPRPGGLLVGPVQKIDLPLLTARFWPD